MEQPVLNRDLGGNIGRSLREPRQLVHRPGCKQSGAAGSGGRPHASIGAWGSRLLPRRLEC